MIDSKDNKSNNKKIKIKKDKFHSFYKRALYSFILIVIVMFIGTVGFHYLENYSYVDAFYFASMLATGEGPAANPSTVIGKIFASIFSFVSVGSVVVVLAFLFGPFFTRLLKIGEEKIKEEEEKIKKEL